MWKLSEWNNEFTDNPKPMTNNEITEGIKYLRGNGYPKPEDCPMEDCPKFRPSCKLNVCNIAVGMCGDF